METRMGSKNPVVKKEQKKKGGREGHTGEAHLEKEDRRAGRAGMDGGEKKGPLEEWRLKEIWQMMQEKRRLEEEEERLMVKKRQIEEKHSNYEKMLEEHKELFGGIGKAKVEEPEEKKAEAQRGEHGQRGW